MKKFWSTSAKAHSWLTLRPALSKSNATSAAFPRFSELPAELRDQIWVHSLEQRVIPLHLRQYPHRVDDIEVYAQESDGDQETTHVNDSGAQSDVVEQVTTVDLNDGDGEESITSDEVQDEVVDEESDIENEIDPRYFFYTMAILTCSTEGRCKCTYSPPSSMHTVPPPAAFSVCHESRDATRHLYNKYLEAEYTIHGHPATGSNGIPLAIHTKPPILRPGQKAGPWDDIYSADYPFPYRTGVFINPAVDALMVDMSIASSDSIQKLHHFVNIMSKQLPDMSRVIIGTEIALPPYKWWRKERFEYWKTMGQDARWIPKNMVQFRHLRDVVVLLGGKTHEKMLPSEWRERTVRIWTEEMERIRQKWPEQWVNDGPPVLRVAGSLEGL